MYTMGRLFTPRPWLLTILFFTLELNILMRSRQSGKARELLWLPLIFALWANIHIQFVDGLLVLGIALAESLLAKWSPVIKTNLKARSMVAIFLACIAATLVNPYGWGVYKVAYELVNQTGRLSRSASFPQFRFAVSMTGVLSLHLLRRERWLGAPFFVLRNNSLAFSFIMSFRSQRDIWVIAVAASAILAAALQSCAEEGFDWAFLRFPL